ncbi:MAG: hypothetical protein Q8Q58_15220 [Candidatus Rokubacteria bacterium]|nr:hypothetical protein [Candidatus Rokubacteria bacterium]
MPLARINGITLFGEPIGRGTPLVCVHEVGGAHERWHPQVRVFGRRYRTCRRDSSRPRGG